MKEAKDVDVEMVDEGIETLSIAASEYEVLSNLAKFHKTVDPIGIRCKKKLSKELEVAHVIEDEKMPDDVVRMGSTVEVNTPFGRKVNLTIVMPGSADFQKGKLSVMSPMGTAVLGHKVGDQVKWHFPKGDELITIESVVNSERKVE
ncbi:MAG: GreA/GreB family elongation factor [Vicingaceae bacterium]